MEDGRQRSETISQKPELLNPEPRTLNLEPKTLNKEAKMKELNRRQFFNLLVTGAAAFVGVTTASAAKRTFAAVHDYTDSASSLAGSIR